MEEIIRNISIYIIPVIFAVTLHEAAHAYAAKWLGDNTAHSMGRTTLNPMNHIDPMGTIVLPLAMYILSGGMLLFGYAKPVPVVESRLRNPRSDMPIVALAGPAANVLMALGWAILWVVVRNFAPDNPFLNEISKAGIGANVLFFAFNMLPILPLDGGRILKGLLPDSLANVFGRLEPYGFFIVIGLAFAAGGLLRNYWISPVSAVIENIIRTIVQPLANIFGVHIPF